MAKRFQFKAEPVLKLRQHRELALRRQLAQAQQRVSGIEGRIADIRAELARQDELVRTGVLTGSVDVQYMSLYRRHTLTLHRNLVQQAQELREAAVALQQARRQLAEAARSRKVLETLRDRLHQRYLEEVGRTEQAASDDMTTTRFTHDLMEEEPARS